MVTHKPFPTQLSHLAQDPGLAAAHIARGRVGAIADRVWQHRGQQRRFTRRQLAGRLMKIALGGRFHTKYPVAELGNIQIDSQDPLFTPDGFYSDSQPGLQPFT